MKRIAFVLLVLGAMGLASVPAAQADPLITCNEYVSPPYLDLNGPGTSDDTINGTGWVRCTAVTTVIEVHVRLIKDGVLLLPTTQTCYADDYCQRIVYSSPSGSHCWKTRAWGYWGQAMTPTGASTSTQFCWP